MMNNYKVVIVTVLFLFQHYTSHGYSVPAMQSQQQEQLQFNGYNKQLKSLEGYNKQFKNFEEPMEYQEQLLAEGLSPYHAAAHKMDGTENTATDDGTVICYFPANLIKCESSKTELYTFSAETNKPLTSTVDEGKTEACLKAKCNAIDNDDRKVTLELTGQFVIGGSNGVSVNPDILEPSEPRTFYGDEAECLAEKKQPVIVTCAPEMSERFDEDGRDIELEDESESKDTSLIQEVGGVYDLSANEQEMNNGVTKLQWNNWFREILHVQCPDRHALFFMKSQHSNHYGDRLFQFHCKLITDVNYNHCYWTGYQNWFDLPSSAYCAADHAMVGVYSDYSGHHRDRRFSLLCCRAPGYYTRTCFQSGYLNGFDGYLGYAVGHTWIFTGMYSWHNNYHEDRIYKVHACQYVR